MLTRLIALLLTIATFALHAPLAVAADHAAANETIWPSQNDVAQTAGDGKKLLENQWAKPTAVFARNNYSLTGLTVPASDADLNIDVALGTAYIAGRHINIPAATSVTATASATNHVFLKLTRDGSNLVTGASFEVNTTGTPPADSTKIATLTAGASSISATTDARILSTTITVLTSGTSWPVPAGITTIYVEVIGASGGGGGGGEGHDGASGGSSGGAGGAGGTTTFGAYTANGGAGGFGGTGNSSIAVGSAGAAQGTASGGGVNIQGGGRIGGNFGEGGSNTSGSSAGAGLNGGTGGSGGYVSGTIIPTPGTTISYAIGAAGTAGAGGTGGGGADGGAGIAGQAGVIVIHY